MATTTRRRLDPALRRAQIIDAAEQVLAGREPGEVTFEEVAEAAGVSRALVYNYFGDRGGLMAAVYLRSFQRLDDELTRALTEQQSPEEQLRILIRSYLELAATDMAAWKLIGSTEATVHPVVQTLRQRRDDQLAQAWGGTARARVAARAVIGLLEAATIDWRERGDCSLDEVADVLFALLWDGLSGLDAGHGRRARRRPSPAATAPTTSP